MKTKTVTSTEAQNNFGRILDDVVQNDTRYVVRRRNTAQAIIVSIAEFESILGADDQARQSFSRLLRELSPTYSIGQVVEEK